MTADGFFLDFNCKNDNQTSSDHLARRDGAKTLLSFTEMTTRNSESITPVLSILMLTTENNFSFYKYSINLHSSAHYNSLQDSLTGEEFNFSQGLAMVNKNNYTLTYSGHGSISSHQEHSKSFKQLI